MPKPGFKSITISETVYEKFHEVYEKNKDKLTMKGVNSFAGYITYMLEDTMQKDKTFAKYAPKLELVSIEDDRVIIRNNIQNRIAEIVYQRGELYCQLCEAKDCIVQDMFGQFQKFMRNLVQKVLDIPNKKWRRRDSNPRTPERRDHPFL